MIICDQLDHGGAGRVAACIANGLSARGHHIVFLTNLNKDIKYTLDANVSIRNCFPKRKNGPIKFIKAVKSIRASINETQPDIILGIMENCTLLGWLASLGLHIPVVSTEHNSFERPKEAPLSIKDYIFKFYINKLYDQVTVLTKADKKVIGNRLKNVEVMPNPLFLEPCETNLNKKKIILACGRLDAWHYKGFDLLIQAWGKISANYPEWRMVIVSGGTEKSKNYLMRLCEENNVSASVSFAGQQSEMKPFYQEAEVFVLSSRYEGFGLVLTEAMSQQCACVACDYKGRQSEIITDMVDGVLCKCEDVNSLADGMNIVLKDEDYRKKLQKEAVLKSDVFTQDNIVSRWEQLLREVISFNR